MDIGSINAGSTRRKQQRSELTFEQQLQVQELQMIKYSVQTMKIQVDRVLNELDIELIKLTNKIEGILHRYDSNNREEYQRGEVRDDPIHCTTSVAVTSQAH